MPRLRTAAMMPATTSRSRFEKVSSRISRSGACASARDQQLLAEALREGKPLRDVLDARRQKVGLLLLNSGGAPWTADGFRSSWRKACVAAGIVGVTFNDLRGTAATRLVLAGCTEAETATITGHTLRDVRSILDSNYLHRDPELARAAIRKLETRTKKANRPSN